MSIWSIENVSILHKRKCLLAETTTTWRTDCRAQGVEILSTTIKLHTTRVQAPNKAPHSTLLCWLYALSTADLLLWSIEANLFPKNQLRLLSGAWQILTPDQNTCRACYLGKRAEDSFQGRLNNFTQNVSGLSTNCSSDTERWRVPLRFPLLHACTILSRQRIS